MGKYQLKQQVTKEIVEAIREIIGKYSLECVTTRESSYCGKCDETVDVFEFWQLRARQYKIELEDIFEQLLPIEYGKVKK